MPLLSFLASNPDEIEKMSIEQIVKIAGDGRLRDGAESQRELQEYLRQATLDSLASYIDYCLTNSFDKSGFVLQDIVNELGRRLEYNVINGRYQGTSRNIGYDGIWCDPSGYGLVIEVKTTDAYRLSLDTLVSYRNQLLSQNELNKPCSILIVVGRTDTGELEAQVRGSRHAWDIRLISVEALLNLVRVKESTDSQDTVTKIQRLLSPLEYTRLDDLVDVVFTAARDVENSITSESDNQMNSDDGDKLQDSEYRYMPPDLVESIRGRVIKAFGRKQGIDFVKKSRALYWDSNQKNRVACTVSKRYTRKKKYWYAYHQQWHEFLLEGENGFFALCCPDLNVAFIIPAKKMDSILDKLNSTERKDKTGLYYHINIIDKEPGNYAILFKHSSGVLPLEEFTLKLNI